MDENTYSLRKKTKLKSRYVREVRYEIETVTFVGPRIRNSISSEVKQLSSLAEFKVKIKRWSLENCSCKLCKICAQRVSYL